jgi:uncharacterized membrane protein
MLKNDTMYVHFVDKNIIILAFLGGKITINSHNKTFNQQIRTVNQYFISFDRCGLELYWQYVSQRFLLVYITRKFMTVNCRYFGSY